MNNFMDNIIILIVIIFVQFYILLKNKNINRLLLFLIFLAFVLWYFIPIILTLLHYHLILYVLDVSFKEFTELAFRELLFYSIILILFNLFQIKRNLNRNENLTDNLHLYFTVKWFFRVAVGSTMLYISYILIYKMNYLENNELNNQEGGVFQIFSLFSSFFISYFWVLIIYGKKDNNRKVAISIVFIYSIVSLLSGSRVYLLNLLLLFYFIYKNQDRLLTRIRSASIIIIVFFISIVVLPYLSQNRSEEKVSEFGNISQQIVFEEMNLKLNSIAYSTILLKYDGENFAGFNPYIGSLLKFIPRFLWENKPTATSYNSSVNGIPSRRVPDLLGVNSDTYNVGVSPYAVSAWQMGLLTIVTSIVLNLLLLMFLNFSLNHSSLYLKSIAIMLIGIPQLIMIFTSGDNIIQNVILGVFFFLLLLMFKLIKFKRA